MLLDSNYSIRGAHERSEGARVSSVWRLFHRHNNKNNKSSLVITSLHSRWSIGEERGEPQRKQAEKSETDVGSQDLSERGGATGSWRPLASGLVQCNAERQSGTGDMPTKLFQTWGAKCATQQAQVAAS